MTTANTMAATAEPGNDPALLRQLFDDYLRMYASRDDGLTTYFSENFSGFTGGGDFLVKDRAQWVEITRQDFAQVKEPIRIELKDVSIQSLQENIAVATGFFTIHLPIKDHVLSRETARLVLIFRREAAGWKITHSSISIPYYLVREGEVYPLQELTDRNQFLEKLAAERTQQLSKANDDLQRTNAALTKEIADRQQTDEALQRSEALHRSILYASPDNITITDLAGKVVMVSTAALKMYHYTGKEEFIGRPVTDFIAPEDRERAMAQIALKSRGIQTGPNEYRGLRPNGSAFDIEVNSEFFRDAAGAPAGMVFIVRDITGRKQAEAERKKLEAQNRQLQKTESLGRMAEAIAHHFNNQLQGVMMGLELAQEDMQREAGPMENLNEAMQCARKAAEVSQLILTYLGYKTVKKEAVDLSGICRQGLDRLRTSMPPGAMGEPDLRGTGPFIAAEASQIQQVLRNLVTNAWEASETSGKAIQVTVLTLAPDRIPTAHRFPVDWQPQATSYACLQVADEGCGIPSQQLENIFDPFYSTKFPGRGMGLAVALGIVRVLDGAMAVTSEPGRGSRFQVFLPEVFLK